ncbi:MAG: hypothetical protein ACOYL5_15875 [Phototrophicaceae bacterium]
MNRRIFFFLLLGLLTLPMAIWAQSPEYTAFFVARRVAEDGLTVVVTFGVSNQGGASAQPIAAELRAQELDQVVARGSIPPLGAGEVFQLELPIEVALFALDAPQTQLFELTLRSNELPQALSLARYIEIPAALDAQTPLPTPTVPIAPPVNELPAGGIDIQRLLTSLQERITAVLPLDNPLILAAVGGLIVLVALVIWLLWVIARLLFSRKPSYPAAVAPYAAMPTFDPNSLAGRRQQWQFVAPHGSMLVTDVEGNLHARKLLLGAGGTRYEGWTVIGLRASQYDTYGRVAQTQVIAPSSGLTRLTARLRKANTLTPKQAKQQVRGLARTLARELGRKITRRRASLPVALDVKFRGAHGEVRILFELYQYQGQAWRKLDTWQPEMTVGGKYIYESYTFTAHGRQDEESMGAFRRRLHQEFEVLLAEMLLCTPPPIPSASPATTTATHQAVNAASASAITPQSLPKVEDWHLSQTNTHLRPVPPQLGQDDPSLMDTLPREYPRLGGDAATEEF